MKRNELLTYILYRIIALLFLILLIPIFVILYVLVKLTSRGPFIFKQKRMGKNKKIFTIYKIRTMAEDAEKLRAKLKDKNEADWPAFKIHNDPRYTSIGKIISHTAFDELPQLVNVLKGEMSFVGPRPLPIEEAKNVPKKYDLRFSVLPGMTSPWIVQGADHRSFRKWMQLDMEYTKNKSLLYDVRILSYTTLMVIKMFFYH